jgi:hypothetical protein
MQDSGAIFVLLEMLKGGWSWNSIGSEMAIISKGSFKYHAEVRYINTGFLLYMIERETKHRLSAPPSSQECNSSPSS